ncbi:MAG: RagB/SusD family nutrient uptake outer membrane protein [Muribaculaceae bacterium]|nr:RagB/SusD family nutrient uptake outer membrane protein [Muribaculaceae bacterium]
MKFINKIIYGSVFALSGLGLNSCDSFLQEYSQDLAKVNSWEDLDEVLLGAAYLHTGMYYDTGDSYFAMDRDDHFDILHFMSDEIRMSDKSSQLSEYYTSMFPFFTWQQDTGVDNQFRYTGGDEIYFNSPYSRINVCNMVISLIDEQPSNSVEDDRQKSRVKGEAYFLRGLYYFFLANLYCEPYDPSTADNTMGLPLKFSEVIEDTEFQRASLADTYAKVLEDLEIAEKCLESIPHKSLYRADVTTVRLLQSRVYLYMQDWDNAIAKAKEVLDSNDNLLRISTKNIGDTCLDSSSPEVLFSMGDYLIAYFFQDNRSTKVAIHISDDMLALYSDDDYRKDRYIGETANRGKDIFRKVNGQREAMGSYTTVGSTFCFRTPEAYFTLAEASAYKGDDATARQVMEKFLATRMRGDVAVSESGNDLIDLIRDERAREFLLEGHRWFDLRRYTVCGPYPWSKEIIHGYIYETQRNYKTVHDHTDWYRLEKNDIAYTLPIPRKVRNFQTSLGNISRPNRKAFDVTKVHGSSYDNLDSEESGGNGDYD